MSIAPARVTRARGFVVLFSVVGHLSSTARTSKGAAVGFLIWEDESKLPATDASDVFA